MKKSTLVVALAFSFIYTINLNGQGCVAIRGNTTCGSGLNNTLSLKPGEFNAQLSYRYFKSFRHFRGDVQETHRLEEGTEVINHSTFVDLSLNYGITERFFANVILPFVHHRRSSMYEHGGNPPNGLGERHETVSSGLADVRLGLGYWLFDPQQFSFNYSLALGVKLPTGQFDYSDTFYNQGENRDMDLEKVVDQSIQPGDGGTGLTLDIQGFHPLTSNLGLSMNLYYLFNVQETNGVLTRNGRSEFSCADQYAATLSGYYNLNHQVSFLLGGRLEGVPSEDLIGGSAGYRRPGYAFSVEPGLNFNANKLSVFITVPIAVYRNRVRSYEDKARTEQTGVYRHGDAAFADYLVNLGVAYRFGGKQEHMLEEPFRVNLDE